MLVAQITNVVECSVVVTYVRKNALLFARPARESVKHLASIANAKDCAANHVCYAREYRNLC